MNQILCIALALLVGLLSTRLMKLVKLPNVTGFLLSGILFGPYVLGPIIGGWTPAGTGNNPIDAVGYISDIALGFIAFSIGCSFKLSSLKAIGKRVLIITIFEALGGSLIAFGGLAIASIWLGDQLPMSVVISLAAIASATAPAATLLVIRQYKADGPVVRTLIPVVAFDDAVALILFAVLFNVSKSISVAGESINIMEILVVPLLQIVLSLALGAAIGFVISMACHLFKSRANRMVLIIASVLGVTGLTMLASANEWKMFGVDFNFSNLLTMMMVGAMFINFRADATRTTEQVDRFTQPIYMLFFIISGANLDITIFGSSTGLVMLGIALIYVVFRAAGKWLGAFTSAKITKSEPTVQKYLGFTLFPQAGVAIGLATTAAKTFGELGSVILAIILSATIVYELTGPVITKIALQKAGEIPNTKISKS